MKLRNATPGTRTAANGPQRPLAGDRVPPTTGGGVGPRDSLPRRLRPSWRSMWMALAALVVASFGLAVVPTARAATTAVNCTYNDLANAVANASSGDTLTFDADCTITFTQTISIDKTLTISGIGHTVTLDGGGGVRVFLVANGGNLTLDTVTVAHGNRGLYTDYGGNVTITHSTFSSNSGGGVYNNGGNVTITHSTFSGNSGGGVASTGTLTIADSTFSGNSAGDGGAVYDYDGNLSITRSTFSDNSADFGGGGAVWVNNRNTAATLAIADSTFSGNSASGGGAVYNYQGTLTITNSTFSGNSAHYWGSATNIGGGGAVSNLGILTITNSTFSGNSAASGGGVANYSGMTITNSTFSGNSATGSAYGGGGAANYSGMTITNSTFSGNSAALGGGGVARELDGTLTIRSSIVAGNPTGGNCAGQVTDGGYNLTDVSDTSCGFSDANHDVHAAPMLGSLANNGGPTQTMALPLDSPAVNQIPSGENGCGTTITTDQRGVARPQGPACDIGAYEVEQPADTTAPTITITSPVAAPPYPQNQSTPLTIHFTVEDEPGGSGVNQASVKATLDGQSVTNGQTITLSTLAVGSHTFTVMAADNAGNPASATVVFVVAPPGGLTGNLKGINLAGADLSGLNLSNSNLMGGTITGADLSGANLRGVNLKGANLSGANLSEADLTNANLQNANLTGADLTNANLTGANLLDANLTNATIKGATLTGTQLNGVTWNNTTCRDGSNSNDHNNTCIGY